MLFHLIEVVTTIDCIANEEAVFWLKNMWPMSRGIAGGGDGGGCHVVA